MFIDKYISGAEPVRGKILLVDDQVVNIKILHQLLQDDYDIYMARDGNQAIEMCKKVNPDLVLLDIEMPILNGFDVCAHLKNDPDTQEVAVIFVSGHFDEDKEVRGFQLGAVDFIHKPINPVITKARIKNQIRLKLNTDLLRTIALIDGLTGVANRRQFEQVLPVSWSQCAREKQPLTVILLDIDFFKHFNDTYGHTEGDVCLRLVAQKIHDTVNRPYDLVARFGGEEFICILPNTDLIGGTYVAQQIVDSIVSLKIPHINSPISAFVTISAGVSSVVPEYDMSSTTLIEEADKQLYIAKDRGRNRVLGSQIQVTLGE
ncbi:MULTISPECIES: diguanylate cyclase [Shewanella]|uniref:diguanylate cyclase n=1 Tax=Shewanella TaxID=22 RepID=UPI000C3DF626|nr:MULTISPECIES: diguanylate cyclase [Shewanella]NCQ44511.1 diguanylate cyclase [Shewanella frigidimarina]NCO72174.1 diguanylate cyclase [Shewanella vesiculosa]NCP35854.1 diguanylate cyclase [Shewanella vesiculosa]NCP68759.1 diguanylate cyclase [Shewanella vesiculosa]NCP73518.1 diguanylate cyclase [Shewanella vesiculosa]